MSKYRYVFHISIELQITNCKQVQFSRCVLVRFEEQTFYTPSFPQLLQIFCLFFFSVQFINIMLHFYTVFYVYGGKYFTFLACLSLIYIKYNYLCV